MPTSNTPRVRRKQRMYKRRHGHCECCKQMYRAAQLDCTPAGGVGAGGGVEVGEDLATILIRGKRYPVNLDNFEMVPRNDTYFKMSLAKRVVHKPSGTPLMLVRFPNNTSGSGQKFASKIQNYNKVIAHTHFPLQVSSMSLDEEKVLLFMGDADLSLHAFIANAHAKYGGVSELTAKKIIHSLIVGLKQMPVDAGLVLAEKDFLSLNPANTYLSLASGTLHSDFGIYRLLNNESERVMYNIGAEYEYLYYTPERINPTKETWTWTRTSWILGLILIEMMTGRHPCSHYGSTFEKLKAIVMDDPETHIPNNLSPTMTAFLKTCLKKHPRDRLTNAQLLKTPFFQGFNPRSVDLSAAFIGHPCSLMHHCRTAIHRHLGPRRILHEDCLQHLPLPQKIKDYLV